MPENVEEYGQLLDLDPVVENYIKTGFDEIRSFSGWENFRIPEYVWDYVDKNERDRLLTFLITSIYTTRSDNTNFVSFSREATLAWGYFWGVLLEWFSDMSEDDFPFTKLTPAAEMHTEILTILEDNCGIPSDMLSNIVTDDVDEDGDLYVISKGYISAPPNIFFTSSWLEADIPYHGVGFQISNYISGPDVLSFSFKSELFSCESASYDEFQTIVLTTGVYVSTDPARPPVTVETQFEDLIDYATETYDNIDGTDRGVLTTDWPTPIEWESEIQQYGILDGLDSVTAQRIMDGFDKIREYSNWDGFRIPSYVWDYVDQYERDRILDYAYDKIYTKRLNDPYGTEYWDDNANLPKYFAIYYQAALWVEWRKANTEFADAGADVIFNKYITDSGLDNENINMWSDYYSSPEKNTYGEIHSFPWVVQGWWIPCLYIDIWVEPAIKQNYICLYDANDNTIEYSTDSECADGNYLSDSVFDYYNTPIADWDDIGIAADWPKEEELTLTARPRVMVVWA